MRPRAAPSADRSAVSGSRSVPGRHQQPRDVRAGDQQQEGDRSTERKEACRHASGHALVQRHDAAAKTVARLRCIGHRLQRHGGHLGLRLLESDSGPEPGHDAKEVRPFPQLRRGPLERQPQRGRVALVREAPRHHADDFVRAPVDGDRPSDDGRVAAEPPLPETVAEDDDRRGAVPFLAGDEPASELRRNAEHPEEAGAHHLRLEVVRPPAPRQGDLLEGVHRLHGGKEPRLVPARRRNPESTSPPCPQSEASRPTPAPGGRGCGMAAAGAARSAGW